MFRWYLGARPEPTFDPDATPQFLITQLGYDKYLGRLTIGRLFNGTLKKGQPTMVLGDGFTKQVRLAQLFTYQGLQKIEAETLNAGDIGCLAGIDVINIGDTVSDIHNPTALPRLVVDEPTIGITFATNDSPTSGNDGKIVTGRQIRERLEKEACTMYQSSWKNLKHQMHCVYLVVVNFNLRFSSNRCAVKALKCAFLKPEVKLREVDGKTLEPYELATLDFPEKYGGYFREDECPMWKTGRYETHRFWSVQRRL